MKALMCQAASEQPLHQLPDKACSNTFPPKVQLHGTLKMSLQALLKTASNGNLTSFAIVEPTTASAASVWMCTADKRKLSTICNLSRLLMLMITVHLHCRYIYFSRRLHADWAYKNWVHPVCCCYCHPWRCLHIAVEAATCQQNSIYIQNV